VTTIDDKDLEKEADVIIRESKTKIVKEIS
jgi:hypothetical protein